MRTELLSKQYIQAFIFLDSLCEFLGTRSYIWGGWTADIYSGRILRDHNDAESFVVNLYTYRDTIQKVFDMLGWQTEVLDNDDLKLRKHDIKFQLGNLEIKGDKARWFHNGKKGQILFPKKWLNEEKISFKGKIVHAVCPQFQYILKLHPEFMNPLWTKLREKDVRDILMLKKLISDRHISLSSLEGKMFSI